MPSLIKPDVGRVLTGTCVDAAGIVVGVTVSITATRNDCISTKPNTAGILPNNNTVTIAGMPSPSCTPFGKRATPRFVRAMNNTDCPLTHQASGG
jgi:hypothetical protein